METAPLPLDRAEYVEQAYLFQLLRERSALELPMQELLEQIRFELLATTKLPIAVDYLLTELKHSGQMSSAMSKMSHYFTPFQAFLINQAEGETGRFTMETALQVLEAEAKYRIENCTPAGLFTFQFEVLCRNRLHYDRGLTAISSDPYYSKDWAKWILLLRAQVGLVDIADLIFLASEEYAERLKEAGQSLEGKGPFLFGRKEGRIAMGNRTQGTAVSLRRPAAPSWLPSCAPAETKRGEQRRHSTVDAACGAAGVTREADGRGATSVVGHYQVLQEAG